MANDKDNKKIYQVDSSGYITSSTDGVPTPDNAPAPQSIPTPVYEDDDDIGLRVAAINPDELPEDVGFPIDKVVTTSSGSKGGLKTDYGSTTTGLSVSEKEATVPLIVQGLPVPELYEKKPYSANTLSGIMQQAADRKKKLEGLIYDDTQLERRRSKVRAWSKFGQALGQIAGVGRAPVEKMDMTPVMQSFARLDQLRLERNNIANDPTLNWMQKLIAQDRIDHEKREEQRYLQSVKDREAAMKFNVQEANKAAREEYKAGLKEVKRHQSNVEGAKETNRWDRSEKQSVTFINPDVRDKFMNIGQNYAFPINDTEAIAIWNEYITLTEKLKNPNYETVTQDGKEYVKTAIGVLIPKERVDAAQSYLESQLRQIWQSVEPDGSISNNLIKQMVNYMDELSGYAYSKAIARRRTMPTSAGFIATEDETPGLRFNYGVKGENKNKYQWALGLTQGGRPIDLSDLTDDMAKTLLEDKNTKIVEIANDAEFIYTGTDKKITGNDINNMTPEERMDIIEKIQRGEITLK